MPHEESKYRHTCPECGHAADYGHTRQLTCHCCDTPMQCAERASNSVLNKYRALHDGLSDMIEGGRLQEGDIPDDYQWLVGALVELAGLDPAGELTGSFSANEEE